MGLGFVHFLYDRWVWKLSDPLGARNDWSASAKAERSRVLSKGDRDRHSPGDGSYKGRQFDNIRTDFEIAITTF
jgi:hypothetical protein